MTRFSPNGTIELFPSPREIGKLFPSRSLALLRLTDPGPHPHAPLKPGALVEVGDWVLKLGHPWGYRRDRPAVVRSGRVVAQAEGGFVADCPVTGGDSGGPYFNLDGDLVGISHNGSSDLEVLLPRDPDLAQRCAQPGYGPMTTLASPLIGQLLPRMLNREQPIPVWGGRDNFDLARRIWALHRARPVPAGDWSQGPAVLAAFRSVTAPLAGGVVTILNEDVPIALGTVVAPGGWVVTKASELPTSPMCRLPGGGTSRPQVIGIDPAYDLALLQVPDAVNLVPVTWSDASTPGVGDFVAAVKPDGTPLTAGIISVARRDLAEVKPIRADLPLRIPATRLEVALLGTALGEMNNNGVLVRQAWGRSLAAGIRAGDMIRAIDGLPAQIDARVVGRLSGDIVAIEVLRAGKPVVIRVPLHAEGEYGAANFRSDDFPTVFEHAASVMPHECGGPLVDLSGRVVGITIARAGEHGCMAIPGDRVRRLVEDLRSRKGPDRRQ